MGKDYQPAVYEGIQMVSQHIKKWISISLIIIGCKLKISLIKLGKIIKSIIASIDDDMEQ